MPSYPHPREGHRVKRSGHPIPFVLHAPSDPSGASTRVLATNPWSCIELFFRQRGKPAADTLSFVHQARDFYEAARAAGPTSKPMLLYYAFMNLAKALIRHRSGKPLLKAQHGINEWADNVRQRFTLTSQKVVVQPPHPKKSAVLNDFAAALGVSRLKLKQSWRVCDDLLAQIPSIHRAYSESRVEPERLHHIDEGMFLADHASRRLWAQVSIRKASFASPQSRQRLMGRSYFKFSQVESDDADRCLLQSDSVGYGNSPLESLAALCASLRKSGMVTILTPQGNRYYFTDFEPRIRLHPLLAAYMAIFYFGSVARYRPLDLEKMRVRDYAWLIEEMLATVADQFIYGIASELLEREVTRPWAVQLW